MDPEEHKVKFDLKFDGNYSKIKVANKIILAANHAIKLGTTIHSWQWGITWDKSKKSFRTSYVENNFTWGTVLASVILFSNYTADEPKEKTKVAAEILGVEHDWIKGFLNGLDIGYKRYTSEVYEISRRKSIKGQQCRDGVEIGELLKTGYLAEEIIRSTYQPYTDKNYKTHNWEEIEQNKILLSMGVIQKIKIYKCKNCEMFGSYFFDKYSKTDSFYILKTLTGNRYFRADDIFNYNCDEVIIKNILE